MAEKISEEAAGFIRFERALPHQIRHMVRRRPIAYVPFGALEWHGEHAALGLDGIKASWICEQAARRSGGVLFPAVYWGAFHTLPFPFTFRYSKRAMTRQVRKTLETLAGWGFRSIVMLTGHYPLAQIKMFRRECRRISQLSGVAALGIPEQALAADLGYLGDHAAKWETSILMAIDHALVDMSRLPEDTGTLSERARRHGIYGICPKKEASAEAGRRVLDQIVDRLAQSAVKMLEPGGAAIAEEIYRSYAAAFQNPFAAARIAFGVHSKWEIIRYVVRNVIGFRHL